MSLLNKNAKTMTGTKKTSQEVVQLINTPNAIALL
jgi:hypothetical protein